MTAASSPRDPETTRTAATGTGCAQTRSPRLSAAVTNGAASYPTAPPSTIVSGLSIFTAAATTGAQATQT
jgi:hypothetical protein